MASLSLRVMRDYLGSSISSLNENKLRGLLAEVELRRYLTALGIGNRVSPGGWIVRKVGPGNFGRSPRVFLPEVVRPRIAYGVGRPLPQPPPGMHAVAAAFHRIGIATFFCAAEIATRNDVSTLGWRAQQLGLPDTQPWTDLATALVGFPARSRRHNFLRYHSDAGRIPDTAVPEEFSKEHLRVTISNAFFAEWSDVDGIFYGQRLTYPIEIKEKTVASDVRGLGDWFGLDVGPFTKLAFYAAMGGDLSSLFIVRQIADTQRRALVAWRFATFAELARYAAWTPRGGGPNMRGGGSTVVRIPADVFRDLNRRTLAAL